MNYYRFFPSSRLASRTLFTTVLVGVVAMGAGCSGSTDSTEDRRPQWASDAVDSGVGLCGDDVCSSDEACWSCANDCGACDSGACGDGLCSDDETCSECPTDCGGCDAICGDGTCTVGENCEQCASDCGPCDVPTCGNGLCDDSETCESCATDCGGCAVCGDDVCHADEDCESCDSDCGICPDPCGDGQCDDDENCGTCAQDCGVCTPDEAVLLLESQIFDFVNAVRTTGADCPSGSFAATDLVVFDENLATAARLHSLDMGTQGYFEHDNLEGKSPFTRMSEAGYTGSPGGENIAAGNGTAEATFEQWMTSDGHCRNIMNGSLNELGVGFAQVNGSPYGFYWTQNFGRR